MRTLAQYSSGVGVAYRPTTSLYWIRASHNHNTNCNNNNRRILSCTIPSTILPISSIPSSTLQHYSSHTRPHSSSLVRGRTTPARSVINLNVTLHRSLPSSLPSLPSLSSLLSLQSNLMATSVRGIGHLPRDDDGYRRAMTVARLKALGIIGAGITIAGATIYFAATHITFVIAFGVGWWAWRRFRRGTSSYQQQQQQSTYEILRSLMNDTRQQRGANGVDNNITAFLQALINNRSLQNDANAPASPITHMLRMMKGVLPTANEAEIAGRVTEEVADLLEGDPRVTEYLGNGAIQFALPQSVSLIQTDREHRGTMSIPLQGSNGVVGMARTSYIERNGGNASAIQITSLVIQLPNHSFTVVRPPPDHQDDDPSFSSTFHSHPSSSSSSSSASTSGPRPGARVVEADVDIPTSSKSSSSKSSSSSSSRRRH